MVYNVEALKRKNRSDLYKIIIDQQDDLGGYKASTTYEKALAIFFLAVAWGALLMNIIYIGGIAFGTDNIPTGLSRSGAQWLFWINLILLIVVTGGIIWRAFNTYKGKSFSKYKLAI